MFYEGWVGEGLNEMDWIKRKGLWCLWLVDWDCFDDVVVVPPYI